MDAPNDAVERTRSTYDRIAKAYAERWSQPTPEFVAFQTSFLDALPAGGWVVDLGCGPGRDLETFLARGLRAVGVDGSRGMLDLAREVGPVVQADLRRPPLRNGVWDGVWSSASLLHVPRDDVRATLEAWHELLRSGGLLGLSTSLGQDEGWEQVPYDVEQQPPYEGKLERWFVHHEDASLLHLLEGTGFQVLSTARRTTHRTWLMVLAERV